MRALVLGGGGVIGVAWETGLAAGLLEGGVDLREAELIVGTSAGSLVGTRLAAGQDLRGALPGRSAPAPPLPDGGPDLARLGRIFELWSSADEANEALGAEIGALARGARTVSVETWVESIGGSTGVQAWPVKQLRLTAVDAESGRLAVHDAASGAPIAAAIAASCAVPGMFPVVPIGGRVFMDGGVRSATHADIVRDARPALALVIAPICKATAVIGALAERCLALEVAALRAAGTRVVTVLPGADEIAAFGPNLMDPARADAARDAGRARGLALARGEAADWLA